MPSNDEYHCKLVGLDVYNKDNKDIGTIKDIALNSNGRASAYIVSVGGFLGMGEHYVAVNPEAVNVSYKDNKWHADMNATADRIEGRAGIQIFRPMGLQQDVSDGARYELTLNRPAAVHVIAASGRVRRRKALTCPCMLCRPRDGTAVRPRSRPPAGSGAAAARRQNPSRTMITALVSMVGICRREKAKAIGDRADGLAHEEEKRMQRQRGGAGFLGKSLANTCNEPWIM